jgi:hypothetical protein
MTSTDSETAQEWLTNFPDAVVAIHATNTGPLGAWAHVLAVWPWHTGRLFL